MRPRIIGAILASLVSWTALADQPSVVPTLRELDLTADEFISVAVHAIGRKGRAGIRKDGTVFDYMVINRQSGDPAQNQLIDYLDAIAIEASALTGTKVEALEFSEDQINEQIEATAHALYIVMGHEADTIRLIEEANVPSRDVDLKFPARDDLTQNGPFIGAIQVWTSLQFRETDYLPGCVVQYYRTGDSAVESMFTYVSLDVDERSQRTCVNAIVLKALGIQLTTEAMVLSPPASETGQPLLSDLSRALLVALYSSDVEAGETSEIVREKLADYLAANPN